MAPKYVSKLEAWIQEDPRRWHDLSDSAKAIYWRYDPNPPKRPERPKRERTNKKGDETRQKILALIEADPTIPRADMAKQLRMSYANVYHHIRKLRLEGHSISSVWGKGRPINEQIRRKILQSDLSLPREKLAKKLGIDYYSLTDYLSKLRREGHSIPRPSNRLGKRPQKVLQLYDSGMSRSEIARKFGISYEAVRSLIKRYRHKV